MIAAKDVQVDVLGEPLFEKVNFVIRPGERIAVVGSGEKDVSTFFQLLSGETEIDEGRLTIEGERIAYLSSEILLDGARVAETLRGQPTFLLIESTSEESTDIQKIAAILRSHKGGILINAKDSSLMQVAKTTRVLQINSVLRSVMSFTGSYSIFLLEKEKIDMRLSEAYEKQQKEKRRLEAWLEQKRLEAAGDRSPEKGATIRAKAKYLQREILDKEMPNPML
jgi:ATPase subunit of ABC transporter with duplicated ATPase domains